MHYKWLMVAAAGAVALAFAAGGADARVGQRCGGPLTIACGPGEWCDPAPGTCKPGARGHCVRISQICSDLWKPVCGCNGRSYSNDCWRIMEKEPKRYEGSCRWIPPK